MVISKKKKKMIVNMGFTGLGIFLFFEKYIKKYHPERT